MGTLRCLGFIGVAGFRFVIDYLAEEVLQRPDHVREFLLRGDLDRLSQALCDAVTGGREQRDAESLEQDSLQSFLG
jgi:ATP/maltotriose-dependent transcriptional regulator MalT